jgi:hypothetical protein
MLDASTGPFSAPAHLAPVGEFQDEAKLAQVVRSPERVPPGPPSLESRLPGSSACFNALQDLEL